MRPHEVGDEVVMCDMYRSSYVRDGRLDMPGVGKSTLITSIRPLRDDPKDEWRVTVEGSTMSWYAHAFVTVRGPW